MFKLDFCLGHDAYINLFIHMKGILREHIHRHPVLLYMIIQDKDNPNPILHILHKNTLMAILILHKDIPIPIPTKVTLHKDTHPYNTLTQTLKINVPTSWFNPNNGKNNKPIVTGKAGKFRSPFYLIVENSKIIELSNSIRAIVRSLM